MLNNHFSKHISFFSQLHFFCCKIRNDIRKTGLKYFHMFYFVDVSLGKYLLILLRYCVFNMVQLAKFIAYPLNQSYLFRYVKIFPLYFIEISKKSVKYCGTQHSDRIYPIIWSTKQCNKYLLARNSESIIKLIIHIFKYILILFDV